ncbi:MAG: methyltransferase domain-containing protein [Salibacteraceae bacterium]|jgi:ubiquinone/menaquinone biosynthesis C-methylase UbiE|nr:methyltransferase domain-containing protein [Salibacteraceae bacterium]
MSAEFDAVAIDYDFNFTETNIGKAQRALVWNYLKKHLPSKKLRILEVNCGTGADAQWLHALGHEVIATDLSSEMISVAKQKRASDISFQVAGFHDLKEKFEGQTFDLIFSNFAGLNCVSKLQLQAIQEDFSALLKPKGKFIGVFLGEYCWQERLYFRLKNQPDNINRRLSIHEANIDNKSTQQTHCFSPEALKELFIDFNFIRQQPIGLLVSPSYFEAQLKHWPRLVRLLQSLESAVAIPKWANNADHFLIEFEVKKNCN